MTTIIAQTILVVFLIGILIWIIPDTIRDCSEIATSIRNWIDKRRSAQARAARQIQDINDQANETITRLQCSYWEAQQRMREELDHDE